MSAESMNRAAHAARIRDRAKPWDIVVVGGGATGSAIALDAATRNLDVLLLEQADFGSGTSSRSTKLVHGGVRYLRQGNITLVRDALRERATLHNLAPHLVHDLRFLIPCQNFWQRVFYGVGLKLYDFLASRDRFGQSHGVSATRALELVRPLRSDRFIGGVVYHDGQFDDARLLINMLQTATEHGAVCMNYMPVEGFLYDQQSHISGVIAVDQETQENHSIEATCVINAAGPFCDQIRQFDQPQSEPMIAASQGIHLVLPRDFLPGDTSMIVPKTADGRVVFIIPWHDRAILGTTDTPIPEVALEPTPTAAEISFLLNTAAEYLSPAAQLQDVLSVFTGIRPLVKGNKSARTASLSRDHVIRDSKSGLITITGGKWTTVRKMAEDCINHAVETNIDLSKAGACRTQTLRLHGFCDQQPLDPRYYYGSDLATIRNMEAAHPHMAEPLTPSLSIRKSDIIWATRHEMARTLDDVLSRRTRSLILDSKAAVAIAPEVAAIMAAELNQDVAWQMDQLDRFNTIALHYLPPTHLH